MDVYPDAAERFGQLDPGGPLRMLRALNRWIYPRLDHLVASTTPWATCCRPVRHRGPAADA
jgi:hypothetical protein